MKHRIAEGKDILGEIERNYKKVQEIYLCSPFLTKSAIEAIFRILIKKDTIKLIVITKYEPLDLLLGSSDKEAFQLLFDKAIFKKWDIKIHIVSNLHAKVVLLGTQVAILGSANITFSGMNRNRELCIVIKNDSKILTIREHMKKLINSGRVLDKDTFDRYEKYYLPKFEKRAAALKNLLREFKREFDAGLEGFIKLKKANDKSDYFDGVIGFLKYVDNAIRSREDCLEWLRSHALQGGEKINEARFSLLFNLDILLENDDGVKLTPFGKEIFDNNSRSAFYERLLALFPEFEQIEQAVRENKELHASMLAEAKDQKFHNGQSYWEGRLRWMESLHRLRSFYKGKKKYYALPEPETKTIRKRKSSPPKKKEKTRRSSTTAKP